MSGRTASVKIEQYKILLEYLSSRLSAGHTLEIIVCLKLSERFSRRTPDEKALWQNVKQLNQGMQAQTLI